MIPRCRKSAGTNHLEQKFRITHSMSKLSEKIFKKNIHMQICCALFKMYLNLEASTALISFMVNKKNTKCYICITKINENH